MYKSVSIKENEPIIKRLCSHSPSQKLRSRQFQKRVLPSLQETDNLMQIIINIFLKHDLLNSLSEISKKKKSKKKEKEKDKAHLLKVSMILKYNTGKSKQSLSQE